MPKNLSRPSPNPGSTLRKVTLTLTLAECVKLADLLGDAASESEDDGREGNPDATLLWNVQKQVRAGTL